jgi:hypothetical protein
MKKILFPLLQSNKGGNVVSTISICNKINKKKFNTFVLIIRKKNENKIDIKSLNFNSDIKVDSLQINYDSKILFIINFYFKLIKYHIKYRFDVVHTNDGLLNLYYSILCFLFRADHILHLRNTDNSRRNYLSFFLAKKIICISEFVKNKIPSFFNKKKVVLYNYVDFFNNKIELKRKHEKFIKKNKNKFFVFFISNIHKRKNPKVFIDLISRLNSTQNKFIGLMFFQSEKNRLLNLKKYIKKKKIEKKIILYYNYPLHYWVPFLKYTKKKVLFAPSENEPLGRNIIEAVLKNIYVFANNSGGHKEIIDRSNGILINDIYSNKLNYIVDSFFRNYDRYPKKNSLKKTFIKKFQDKKYIKKIEKIYLEK